MRKIILFLAFAATQCFAQVSVGRVVVDGTALEYQVVRDEIGLSPLVICPEGDSERCSLAVQRNIDGRTYRISVGAQSYTLEVGLLMYVDTQSGIVVIRKYDIPPDAPFLKEAMARVIEDAIRLILSTSTKN